MYFVQLRIAPQNPKTPRFYLRNKIRMIILEIYINVHKQNLTKSIIVLCRFTHRYGRLLYHFQKE